MFFKCLNGKLIELWKGDNAMNKKANVKTVLNGCILLSLLCLLIGASGCNQAGRYQLIGRDSGEPYVIDTTTGKAWTVGKEGPRSHNPLFILQGKIILPGKIGRFKGAYTNSNLYIIDTSMGKAWTR
jgi:hypothetical protein